MVDYIIPSGVRIADADRVRLGAHLADGTTLMHACEIAEALEMKTVIVPRQAGVVSILATDVSTRVLEHARTAIYTEEQIAPIPQPLRTKYLLRSRDPEKRHYRIAPEVRASVRFGHLNFLSSQYGLRELMDVVFFRNVMIYFDRPTQTDVVTKICHHLRPGGHLFLAHSESLQG